MPIIDAAECLKACRPRRWMCSLSRSGRSFRFTSRLWSNGGPFRDANGSPAEFGRHFSMSSRKCPMRFGEIAMRVSHSGFLVLATFPVEIQILYRRRGGVRLFPAEALPTGAIRTCGLQAKSEYTRRAIRSPGTICKAS